MSTPLLAGTRWLPLDLAAATDVTGYALGLAAQFPRDPRALDNAELLAGLAHQFGQRDDEVAPPEDASDLREGDLKAVFALLADGDSLEPWAWARLTTGPIAEDTYSVLPHEDDQYGEPEIFGAPGPLGLSTGFRSWETVVQDDGVMTVREEVVCIWQLFEREVAVALTVHCGNPFLVRDLPWKALELAEHVTEEWAGLTP